jgi:lipopolysaccharide/colanic/teichoic acid biosynthesis glycosyltransferase
MRQDKFVDHAFLLGAAPLQSPWSHRHRRPAPHGVNGPAKASFDRAVAALLLVLLVPVLIGVAVCVKATSRGPVFVRQERVGRDGRLFHLLAFRTTEIDAEDAGHRTADGDWPAEMRPDSRRTDLGAVLRRYGLAELPQLFNVLMGDMSLVGPRPGLPSEVTRRGVDARRRFPVKPGLTGLEPLGGGRDRFPVDSPRIDTDYAENWSLLLDLTILRKTFAAALRGDGAA